MNADIVAEWPIYLPQKLQDKLELIAQYPMTVVAAPMGYGKTVAVRVFLEKCNADVLWSTSFNDNADGCFIDFCAAFQKVDAAFCNMLKNNGLPRENGEQRIFIERLNTFCAERERPLLVVLDQLELSADKEVRAFLYFLIRQVPENFHLVVIGRNRALQLDNDFRFSGSVNFIACDDFEFSLNDIERYAKLCKITLSGHMASKLLALTGGWVALINMNFRELRAYGGIYTREEMLRVIESSLFAPLEEEAQQLLKAVGVCENFTGDQVRFLYRSPNTERWLDLLVNDLYYIRFSRTSGKYHIFSPIAAYLKSYYKICPRQEQEDRLNRLAYWHLQMDENAIARRIFHSVHNFNALMEAVEKRRFIVHYGLDEQEFISYYTDCPPQIRAQHPKAIMTFARQMFALGNYEMGTAVCDEFMTVMRERSDMPQSERCQLMGTYELLLSYACYNDIEQMLTHLHKAKQLLQNVDVAMPWPDTGLNDSSSMLFMYHRKAGSLRKEVRAFSEYAPLYSSLIGGRMDGADLLMQAEQHFVMGSVQEADILLNKAYLLIRHDAQGCVWQCAAMLQARIGLVNGQWESVQRQLEEAKTFVAQKEEKRVFPYDLLLEIFVFNKLGIPRTIPPEIVERLTSRQMRGFRAISMLHYIFGESLLVSREAVKLLAYSDGYFECARKYPNLYAELMLEIEIASAYEMINDQQKAETHLIRALEIAEPDGILMPFVELYRYIRPITERLLQQRTALLHNIAVYGQAYIEGIGCIMGKHFSNVNHGLTSREMEIAQLAAKRLSNQEIAEKLGISESTVKTQLARAFSKLGIQKRRDLAGFFPV